MKRSHRTALFRIVAIVLTAFFAIPASAFSPSDISGRTASFLRVTTYDFADVMLLGIDALAETAGDVLTHLRTTTYDFADSTTRALGSLGSAAIGVGYASQDVVRDTGEDFVDVARIIRHDIATPFAVFENSSVPEKALANGSRSTNVSLFDGIKDSLRFFYIAFGEEVERASVTAFASGMTAFDHLSDGFGGVIGSVDTARRLTADTGYEFGRAIGRGFLALGTYPEEIWYQSASFARNNRVIVDTGAALRESGGEVSRLVSSKRTISEKEGKETREAEIATMQPIVVPPLDIAPDRLVANAGTALASWWDTIVGGVDSAIAFIVDLFSDDDTVIVRQAPLPPAAPAPPPGVVTTVSPEPQTFTTNSYTTQYFTTTGGGVSMTQLALAIIGLREELEPQIDLAMQRPRSNHNSDNDDDSGSGSVDLSGYLALTGGTLTGALVGTDATFSGALGGATLTVSGDASLGNATSTALHVSGALTGSGEDLTLARLGSSTYSTIQHLMNFGLSAGRVTGGEITDGGGGTIDVAAGTGFVRATDSDTADLVFFDWSADTLAIPNDMHRFVGVVYGGGTPQIVLRAIEDWDYDTEFPLGTVVNEGGDIYIMENPWQTGDALTNVIERFDGTGGLRRDERTGGLVISNTGTRNVALSSGQLLARLSEFPVDAVDTSGGDTFDAYYRDGGSGWTKEANETQWNNSDYDDNTGTLAALTAGYYTSRWFYLTADGRLIMLYGQEEYPTLAGALDDPSPASVPDRIMDLGLLVGRFIVQESATIPDRVQSVFGTSFTANSVFTHGELAGLDQDDHLQYANILGRSGGQVFVAGTGAADGLTFQTTNGVGAAGADFVFRGGNNGATEFLRILNGGNVGIGTTSPFAKLSVTGDIALTGGLYDNSASLGVNGSILQTTGTGIEWVATSTLGITSSPGGVDTQVQFNNAGSFGGSADFIWNDASKLLTLGTGNAATQLRLPLSNDATTPTLAFGDGDTGLYESADDSLQFATNGSSKLNLNSSGQLLLADTAFLTPTLSAIQDTDTGFHIGRAANSIEIITGGVRTWFIDSAGDLQVNNTFDGPFLNNNDITNTVPGYAFVGDTNTGIGGDRAGTLSLITDGLELLSLNGVGGIINATASSTAQLLLPLSNDATTPTLAFGDGDTGFYEASDDTIRYAAAGADNLIFRNGIGLYSVNSGSAAGPALGVGGSDTGLYLISTGRLGFAIQGAHSVEMTSGRIKVPVGSVSDVGLSFGGAGSGGDDVDTGFWHPAANTVAVSNTGVETMRWSSTNNVGIGTTSPFAKLSVNGSLALTGGLYDNSASLGVNGSILQTTGSGLLWVATSSLNFDHGGLAGLTDDDHTQYALLAGRAGGQTLIGGTAASQGALTISTDGTSSASIFSVVGTTSATNAVNIAPRLEYSDGVNKTTILLSPVVDMTAGMSLMRGVNGFVRFGGSSTATLTTLDANIGGVTFAENTDIDITTLNTYKAQAVFNASGGSPTVGTHVGFLADDLVFATTNRGFEGQLSAGAGKHNLYMSGTADNYLNGDVSIGTTTTDHKLTVQGTVALAGLNGTSPGGEKALCIDSTTFEVLALTDCTSSSIRFKHDVHGLDRGLDLVKELRPVSFRFNTTNELRFGFIAEEVKEAESRLITYNEEGQVQGLRYNDIIPVLVNAIKELDDKIKDLADRFTAAVVTFTHVIADRMTTKELCLEDVCITKDELQELLDDAGEDPHDSGSAGNEKNLRVGDPMDESDEESFVADPTGTDDEELPADDSVDEGGEDEPPAVEPPVDEQEEEPSEEPADEPSEPLGESPSEEGAP